MKRLLGFSTGAVHNFMNTFSDETIELFRDLGCNALEINCHSYSRSICQLESLEFLKCMAKNKKYFQHLSVHLPSNIRYYPENGSDGHFTLYHTTLFHFRNKLDYILVHPDTVDDWDFFADCKFPVAIENMDNRKKSFRYLGGLLKFFKDHPDLKFVFDVNHFVSTEGSISFIEELIELMSDNIIGIRLSGFRKYHEPLFKTKQFELVESLGNLLPDIPIIIKSACQSAKAVKKELGYIKDILE